jgi:hypothetical protein
MGSVDLSGKGAKLERKASVNHGKRAIFRKVKEIEGLHGGVLEVRRTRKPED